MLSGRTSRTFRENALPPSSGSKIKPRNALYLVLVPFGSLRANLSKLPPSAYCLLGLLLEPEDGGSVPPKCWRTSIRLYGVTSQKTVLFEGEEFQSRKFKG
jgi:hypothetical protein